MATDFQKNALVFTDSPDTFHQRLGNPSILQVTMGAFSCWKIKSPRFLLESSSRTPFSLTYNKSNCAKFTA